jgi:hypothetical protein
MPDTHYVTLSLYSRGCHCPPRPSIWFADQKSNYNRDVLCGYVHITISADASRACKFFTADGDCSYNSVEPKINPAFMFCSLRWYMLRRVQPSPLEELLLRRVLRLTGEAALATGTLQVYGVWISLYIVLSRSIFAGRAGSPLPWLWLVPGVLACFLVAQIAALPVQITGAALLRLGSRTANQQGAGSGQEAAGAAGA